VLAQARGRPHPRACGHFVVHALCGLARATADRGPYAEACQLFQTRDAYNFDPFYGALEAETLSEVALTAAALGDGDAAQAWFARSKGEGGDDEIRQSTVR
jgi:hypothetical protein